MTPEQIELEKLVKNATDALTKACEYANEKKLAFGFAPTYGMGGTYYPNNEVENVGGYVNEWFDFETEPNDYRRGWVSSSHNC